MQSCNQKPGFLIPSLSLSEAPEGCYSMALLVTGKNALDCVKLTTKQFFSLQNLSGIMSLPALYEQSEVSLFGINKINFPFFFLSNLKIPNHCCYYKIFLFLSMHPWAKHRCIKNLPRETMKSLIIQSMRVS